MTRVGGRLTRENVHKAARICALVGGGQILASSELVAVANSSHLPAREVELKGFSDPIQVAAIPWD